MPEDTEPIDMEDLVDPVAEAVSTVPTVEDGIMSMVVEYRNDLNGGLKTSFWLREFGIWARTDKQPEEILLYYATLGDSPQPVNAYQDYRIDIRRYPISIALVLDADVTVTYNPGAFITAADAETRITSIIETKLGEIILAGDGAPNSETRCTQRSQRYVDLLTGMEYICVGFDGDGKPIWKSMADLMDDVEKATTIIGHGEPTSETVGKISQRYMDKDTGLEYVCISTNPMKWKLTSGGGIAKYVDFSIPPEAWKEDTEHAGNYFYYFDLTDEMITEDMIPDTRFDEDSYEVASNAGVCPVSNSYAGYVRLKCRERPSETVSGTCYLLTLGGIGSGTVQEAIRDSVRREVVKIGSAYIREITIPASAWFRRDDDYMGEEGYENWPMQADVELNKASSVHYPSLALDKASLTIAKDAGLCPTIQADDGILRFWAEREPEGDLSGVVSLYSSTADLKTSWDGKHVLPPATRTHLGGVKIPADSGLNVDGHGNLRVNRATSKDVESMYGEGSKDHGKGPGKSQSEVKGHGKQH